MESKQNRPGLEKRITDWQLHISNNSLTKDDIEELSLHLRDHIQELSTKDLNDEDIWLLATHHLGSPKLLDEEFSKVNPDFVTSRNWMMMLWGAMLFFILNTIFVLYPSFLIRNLDNNKSSKGVSKFIYNTFNLNIFFYSMSFLVMSLLILSIWKGRKIAAWLNQSLLKFSNGISFAILIIGFITAFMAYLNLISFTSVDFSEVRKSFDTLIFLFFTSLIILTVYTTLRYRSHDLRTFKIFNENLDWKTAFVLGLIVQLCIQFTFSYGMDALIFISPIPLYGFIGWMISKSKTVLINLFMVQAFLMCLELWAALFIDFRPMFLAFYGVDLLSLAAGLMIGKAQNNIRLQNSNDY